MSSVPWFDDPSVLWKSPGQFYPSSSLPVAQRLNAFVRMIAYGTMLAYLCSGKVSILVLGTGIVLAASLAYHNAIRSETFVAAPPTTSPTPTPAASVPPDTSSCARPTLQNPFGNALPGGQFPAQNACSYDSIKDEQWRFFNTDVPMDPMDKYMHTNAMRQFYTMPCSSGIPDYNKFSEFCYGRSTETCKDSSSACTTRPLKK